MEIRDLEYLAAVADVGSYGRAAEVLRVDVSTLSRRISGLEDELGLLLFERIRTGMRLTSSGQDIVRLARRTLTDLDDLRARAASAGVGRGGRLRLATQTSSLGPRFRALLKMYREAFPDVSVTLTELCDRDAIVGLKDRSCDAAVIFQPAVTQSMATLDLWSERLLLAVPSSHPLATADRVGWPEVQKESLLVRGRIGGPTYREWEAGFIGLDARFQTHNAGCVDLLNLVAIDEGVMVALESHQELGIPGVTFVEIDEPNASIGVSLAWAPELEDPTAGSFVAFVRDNIRGEMTSGTGDPHHRLSRFRPPQGPA